MYLTLDDINAVRLYLETQLDLYGPARNWSVEDIDPAQAEWKYTQHLGGTDCALVKHYRGEFEYGFLVRSIDNIDPDANAWATRGGEIVASDSERTLWILTANALAISTFSMNDGNA